MGTQKQKIQESSDGVGPLYHRVYSIKFPATEAQAKEAMRELQRDPNRFSPQWIARFEKRLGSQEAMKVGDEFDVKLPAPWEAPVRVVDVQEDSFTLATLEGHIEAGRIRFSLKNTDEKNCEFVIESVARSKDGLVDLVYDKLPIARFAQAQMWERFCDGFADWAAGKDRCSPVDTTTQRKNEEGKWETI